MSNNFYSKEIGSGELLARWVFREENSHNVSLYVTLPHDITLSEMVENKDIVEGLYKFCSNKLHFKQLSNADSLLQEIEQKGLPNISLNDLTYIQHNRMSAIISPFIRYNSPIVEKTDIQISPFVSFSGLTLHGFTVSPGSFADFIVGDDYGETVRGYSKEFLPHHASFTILFLEMFCDLFFKFIVNNELPADYEEFTFWNFKYQHSGYKDLIDSIDSTIYERIRTNMSKRIDTITIENETIESLRNKWGMTSRFHCKSEKILKLALYFGKTPYQVEKYLKKQLNYA